METRLLDCTLREGTHLNNGQFGCNTIISVIENLSKSGTEIVEIGFLNNGDDNAGTSHFGSIESAEKLLAQCDTDEETEFALMVRPDRFDVSNIESYRNKCSIVRVAFYKQDMSMAFDAARNLQSSGFDVFLNPIATSTYNRKDLGELATKANELIPRGVNIVDTFGAMSRKRALEIYDQLNNVLNSEMTIGAHLHQNLNLSQAIAQDIVNQKPESRDLIIDGSLYGMGRSPGNLQIELIAEFLNAMGQNDYKRSHLFEIIDSEIRDMKQDYDWGYSPEYSISAWNNVHRTYAERMKQEGAPLADIQELCQEVSGSEYAVQYHEEVFEEYYDGYS